MIFLCIFYVHIFVLNAENKSREYLFSKEFNLAMGTMNENENEREREKKEIDSI